MTVSYDDYIDRTDAGPTIPEDAAREILSVATEKSFVLSTFTRKQMGRKQQRRPVLDHKPIAYFPNSDTGLKRTSDVRWDNLFLNAEPVACIVPIPDDVVADSSVDLWEEIKPELTEAVGAAIDEAVFFGTGKPTLWPDAVLTQCVARAHAVAAGTSTVDVFDDLNAAMTLVETDGYVCRQWVIPPRFQGTLRGTRDANKGFLYPPQGPANVGAAAAGWKGAIWNVPAFVSMMGMSGFTGAPGAGDAQAFVLDTNQFLCAVREDIDFYISKDGVISDDAGVVILNLLQQDSRAVRVVMRVAWQVANPVTRVNPNRATSFPASVLTPDLSP